MGPPAEFPGGQGRYRFIRQIGRGGMGAVYLAQDVGLDRLVAIKVAHPGVVDGQSFRREARLLSTIKHPNVAMIHTLEEAPRSGGAPFLVLEYVAGEPLSARLRRGRIPIPEAMRIGRSIAAGLGHLHGLDQEVAHLDLKPGNVILATTGEVKLLDLGLGQSRWRRTGNLEAPVMVGPELGPARGGTPEYMAPEQARGEPVGCAADVWSFGCVLFECLAGARPFGTARGWAYADAAATGEPDWSLLPTGIAADTRRALERCLVKDASGRGDVEEILALLEQRRDRTPAPVRPTTPSNVPRSRDAFVGRDAERARIIEGLRPGGIVVVHGLSGMGKTRLAREVAEQIAAGESPVDVDAVCWVPLEGLPADAATGQVESVVRHGLSTLSWEGRRREQPPAATGEPLRRWLAEHRVLLVLDNVEHLEDAVVSFCERLPDGQSCVLATSTRNPGVGTTTLRLESLEVPAERDARDGHRSALQLFVERARAAEPAFRMNEANQGLVRGICERLGGIPLAIELAAAQVDALPLEIIERRLIELLEEPAPDRPGRHRTLDAALEWSVRLLSDAERDLLHRAAVFRGGWSFETAERVCADDVAGDVGSATVAGESVFRLLRNLVNRSVVSFDPAERRYAIAEPIRRFVLERMTGDHAVSGPSIDAVRDRHLEWCLELAEMALPDAPRMDEGAWLQRMQQERDNAVAALVHAESTGRVVELARLARALDLHWWVHGPAEEGCAWYDRALQHEAELDVPLRVALLNAAGTVGQSIDPERSERILARGLQLVERHADQEWRRPIFLTNLGLAAQYVGRPDVAATRYRAAEGLWRATGADDKADLARLNLAIALKQQGDGPAARSLLESLHATFTQRGDRTRAASAAQSLGEIAVTMNEPALARRWLRRSHQTHRDLGNRNGYGRALIWRAVLELRHDRPARARALREWSLRIEPSLAQTRIAYLRAVVDELRTALDADRESVV